MRCYYCGATLDATDFCPECEADVRIWKKINASSNILYNEGLERAKVRDLSGAIESLRMSLRYNKLNIDARNLLGLVYYEMGEAVNALSEWVISKSLMPVDNPADHYLNDIQNSASHLDKLSSTTKKFNQGLLYCQQGNDDLAIIQLKKVVSLNPKMVRAHQLLALCYMKQNRYDLAIRSLRQAEKIDSRNTNTMRYIHECRLHGQTRNSKSKKKEEAVSYQSGNETIISPVKLTDNTAVLSVLNLLIGAAIGIAVIWFLVIPEIRQNARTEANNQVVAINETVAAKDDTIKSLEAKIESLEGEVSTAQQATSDADSKTESYSVLMDACAYYLAEDYVKAGEALGTVDKDLLADKAVEVYDDMYDKVQDELLSDAFKKAHKLYEADDYEGAIEQFLKVTKENPKYKNGDACFYLAFAYYHEDDEANALKWFKATVDNTSDSEMKNTSKDMIEDMEARGIKSAQ